MDSVERKNGSLRLHLDVITELTIVTMQSSLIVWTPTKSSPAVDVVSDDLSMTDNFVTRTLAQQGARDNYAGRSQDFVSGG